MSYIVFFIAALGTLAGAIGVIALKDPFYSVLALVVHLLSLAVLFLLLHAEFVAAAQVVVYAGAVMVLYVFVVSYVGGENLTASGGPGRAGTFGAFACAGALVIELFIAVLGSGLKAIGTGGAHVAAGFGNPEQIGTLFLTRFLAPFEIASFLLLLAAVGAVTLARRRGGLEDGVEDRPTISAVDFFRPRPYYTGTQHETLGSAETLTAAQAVERQERPT
ncbi:MAG TPA: NADH-quinone oxidoreductase subunit J [Solirubrobacteraceae bacterium]|nr:NADH-quinone oxidoreductase subunit J [Solirubrobacteraceae bacterium]